jgi:phage tail sheath protein FI
MAEYLAPGVFIEERASGPAVIQGVSTSNFGSVAWTPRGPTGEAVLITSFDQFIEQFGSYWANSYIAYAMSAFFQNGGSRAYFVREVPTDAVAASCDIESAGPTLSLIGWAADASGDFVLTGAYEVTFDIDGTTDTDVDISGDLGVTGTYAIEDIVANINAGITGTTPASVVTDAAGLKHIKITSPTADASSEVQLTPGSTDGLAAAFGYTAIKAADETAAAAVDRWNLTAYSEGAWGNLLKFCLQGNDNYTLDAGGWSKFDVLVYEESSLGEADYVVQEQMGPVDLTDSDAADYIELVVNDKSDRVQIAEGANPGKPWQLAPLARTDEPQAIGDAAALTFTGYLNYPAIVRGTVVFTITAGTEGFTDNGDGTLTGDQGGSGTIDYNTGQYSITFNAAPVGTDYIWADYTSQSQSTEACCTPTSGADGTGPLTRTQVTDPALQASRRGIYAMDAVEDLINVALPDFAGTVPVASDLISWAEARKDRFIILDTESDLDPQEAVDYRRFTLNANTSFAALYWPWVQIQDPVTLLSKDIPASGFVAGVYARTDQDRNVGKAPAGINDGRLNGAIGVEYETTFGQREILNPASVNVLVDTPQTGRAVWGARSLSLDTEWLYIQVRRLFMFVEKSTFLATHWAVFENNGPALWARIRMSLNGFLLNLHNDGYFAGTTPEESYRVVCDATNNPQSAIDAGLMTCDVYLAANKPGEFIRFRFQQMVKSQ